MRVTLITEIKMVCIVHRRIKLEIFRAEHSLYFKTCSSYFKQRMYNDQTARPKSEKKYYFLIFVIQNQNISILVI